MLFELSNAFVSESGITAAIIAGMVVGNMRSQALGEIAEFKEQLTVLLIALLAADVRLASVAELGVPGALTVLALMIVVRPVCVALCTYRTGLSIREKLFLAWLAPRGIVAAAVASLFALQLTDAGIEGGVPMKALVFLVIAVTVTVQGILAGPIAHLLGVKRTTNTGLLFLGANSLARHLGRRFADAGEEVLLIDSNPDECRAAQEAGLKVFYGNGLEIIRCDYDGAAGTGAKSPLPFAQAPEGDILPLMGIRHGRPFLLSEKYTAKPGDQIELAINTDRRGNALEWLQSAGWIPID